PRGGFTAVVESLINLARDNGVHFELGTGVTEIVTFGKTKQGRHKLSSMSRVNPRVRVTPWLLPVAPWSNSSAWLANILPHVEEKTDRSFLDKMLKQLISSPTTSK